MHGLIVDEMLDEAVSACTAQGAKVEVCTGDVSLPETATELVACALSSFGRIDGLVNNAGRGIAKDFNETEDADWDRMLQVFLMASVRTSRNAYAALRETSGAVVNISSVAAPLMLPTRTAYGAVKSAVEGLTRTLGCEWAPTGVRVNAIAPGTILTPLVKANFENGTLDHDRVLERTPMRRFGNVSEIASVARFLLSDASSYITAQTIRVDGGWSSFGGW